ncbi:E1-E2 ATPase-domain-containing protein [Paramyrothecium foliicola]|nr:E1-E2 ATPase-domain-containing protein [Paramyrothecium foliicola]
MACDSGCCGPPKPAASDTPVCESVDDFCDDASASPTEDEAQVKLSGDACSSGCCGPPPLAMPSSAQPAQDCKPTPASCQDKCCDDSDSASGSKLDVGDSASSESDCCAPKKSQPECGQGCCSGPKPKPQPARLEEPAPSCCAGKASPCCDESCLDRLALRECESAAPSTSSACRLVGSGKPCSEHARKARETYTERLEALGCICRALIALGKESCCSPRRRSPAASLRRRSMLAASRPRTSIDSCCAPKVENVRASVDSCCAEKSCCTEKAQPAQGRKSPGQCGKGSAPRPRSAAGSCADACCTESKHGGLVESKEATSPSVLEKGLSTNSWEHVIISISGMTCTGCETKLNRTLGAHPLVRNLKTSLVLSRAEFDVADAASVDEVLKHLERTTEFKCERVTNRGATLCLIVPDGNAAAFVNRPWPQGVLDIKAIGKDSVEVNFDASVIGARDLYEGGWGDAAIRLAPPRPDPTLEASSKHVRHVGLMTLLSTVLTIPVLVLAWAQLPERELEYSSASLALATIVQFVVAGPFYPKALKAMIFSRVIEMDLLIVLSTSAAYIFSLVSFGYMVSGKPLSTGSFFETSTLLVTLIMVGRWVSAFTRQKAVESISIRSLQAQSTYLVTDSGEEEIDTRLLQYGDVFKVVPESRIPTDGTVVLGSSDVDESMLTGESRPVEKQTRSPVIAGSLNGSGTLHVRLTRLPGDNTISTIAGMVDEAKLSKPKLQALADRVASYFVPVIVLLTIITFCIWIAIGVKVRGQNGSEATIQAITYAITVLIVSCPCAIGLAVPMVIVIASGVAAKRGVIFKSAEAIEIAYKTSHVVLDKTGTVTEGKLKVAREWYSINGRENTRSLLLGLLHGIKHPVSAAVAQHLQDHVGKPAQVSDQKVVSGKGVEGTAKDSDLFLQAGNTRWLGLDSHEEAQSFLSGGFTTFCFTIDGSVAAIFGLADSIRPDASTTIKTLLERNIEVHLISGDDSGAVHSVAAQLGILEANVRASCSPADKRTYIQGLLEGAAPLGRDATRSKKPKQPIILFCGDGTNDAVALAQATIGVHMNEGGTEVAQSAADVVLMRPDLSGILTAITVSRKSIHRVAFNFGWSFVYNLFAILLAAGAFVNARIPPEFAGLGEIVSVLPVIVAAVLLRWAKV